MRRLNRSVTLVCAVFFLALGLALALSAYRIFTTTMFERYQKQMTSLLDYDILIGVILLFAVLFICLLLLWLRANATSPLRLLEKSVSDYAAESTGKRDPDELIFYPPHIRTGNEVQSLSQAVTKLSQDMRDYVKGLLAAEKDKLVCSMLRSNAAA